MSCFSISPCPSWTASAPRHGCGRSNRCEGKRISSDTNLPVFWLSPGCHRSKTSDERLKRALMDSKSSFEIFGKRTESLAALSNPLRSRHSTPCSRNWVCRDPHCQRKPARRQTSHTIASSTHPHLSVLGAVVPSYYRISHSPHDLTPHLASSFLHNIPLWHCSALALYLARR